MKRTNITRITAVIFTLIFTLAFLPVLTANAAVIDDDTALYAKAPESVVAHAPESVVANANSLNKGVYICGDVDEDGVIKIMDATLVQKYTAETITLDEVELSLADVNGDGKVDIVDCTAIQKIIVGLD